MAVAALIIVGLLLISSTLIASLLLQRRAELRSERGRGADLDDSLRDEYADRLRSKLRSRLSHELRTPLNSIISLSQLLIEDEHSTLTREQRRYIDVIRRNGRNLLALVDNLGGGSSEKAEDAANGAATEPESLEAADAAELAGNTVEAPRPNGPVLLIEDDPIERQRVASFVEAAGYEVTRAASGEEGLALMRARAFAVVVLDLIMPEMTGLDVLRAARTEDRLTEMRFIVLSAMYMTKSERQVLGPRVVDVVRKGETMARALTFALRRAVKPATPAELPAPGDGTRHP
jgi:CheY-like chemotaxis protein